MKVLKVLAGIMVLSVVVFLLASGWEIYSSTRQVTNTLNKALKVGDSREKIESTLKDIKSDFSYDKYQQRYTAIVRDVYGASFNGAPFRAISVDIYLDKSGNMSRIEVVNVYTAP